MNEDTSERLAKLEAGVGEIRGTLTRLEPMIIKILEAQAEMRGEMRGQFDQIGQRISDINARQPVTLAWQPPEQRRAGGG